MDPDHYYYEQIDFEKITECISKLTEFYSNYFEKNIYEKFQKYIREVIF